MQQFYYTSSIIPITSPYLPKYFISIGLIKLKPTNAKPAPNSNPISPPLSPICLPIGPLYHTWFMPTTTPATPQQKPKTPANPTGYTRLSM